MSEKKAVRETVQEMLDREFSRQVKSLADHLRSYADWLLGLLSAMDMTKDQLAEHLEVVFPMSDQKAVPSAERPLLHPNHVKRFAEVRERWNTGDFYASMHADMGYLLSFSEALVSDLDAAQAERDEMQRKLEATKVAYRDDFAAQDARIGELQDIRDAARTRIAELERERRHVVTQSNALAEASRGLREWIEKNRSLIRAEIDEDVARMKADIGEAEALIAEVQAAVPVPAETHEANEPTVVIKRAGENCWYWVCTVCPDTFSTLMGETKARHHAAAHEARHTTGVVPVVSTDTPEAEGQPWHWGPDPVHGGLTKHVGLPNDCPSPADCSEALVQYSKPIYDAAERIAGTPEATD